VPPLLSVESGGDRASPLIATPAGAPRGDGVVEVVCVVERRPARSALMPS